MRERQEAMRDVAHLGHIELLSPKPEESLRFFCDGTPPVSVPEDDAAKH